jgi:hypothetical protein
MEISITTCCEGVLSPAYLSGSIRAIPRTRHQSSRPLDRPLRIRMESKRDGGYCSFSHYHAATSSLLRSFTHSFSHALTHQFSHKLIQSLAQSFPDPEIRSPDSFIHSVHSLPHSATLSLTFSLIHPEIHSLSLLHSATP